MSNAFLKSNLLELPTKRVIIAGSRTYRGGVEGIERAVKASGFDCEVVICGCALGADSAGHMWAHENGRKVECFPADWKKLGKGAGIIRNGQMAEVADALIAIWDGGSRGTKDMIRRMEGKPTMVYWEGEWHVKR